MLPRSDHLVALDREREQVIDLTRDFVLGRGDSLADRQRYETTSIARGGCLTNFGSQNFTRMCNMGSATGFENLERRIEEQFGLKRGIVLAVGIACLALGVLSIALPVSLYGTFDQISRCAALRFGGGQGRPVADRTPLGGRAGEGLAGDHLPGGTRLLDGGAAA